MSDTIENAYLSAQDELRCLVNMRLQGMLEKLERAPESPIETAMLIALLATSLMLPIFRFEGDPISLPVSRTVGLVRPQVVVGKYRLDFMIEVSSDGVERGKIAVECDGFDYHDRTKEAATRDKARDRALTAQGIRVMRFTGSEIHRNAMACANDVVSVVLAVSHRDGVA